MTRCPKSVEPNEKSRLLQSPIAQYGGSTDTASAGYAEDPKIYKSRWRSIRVMYLTMFLSSVTFSITMTSIWPFLHLLDSEASTDFLGWVVAAYSVGQLIASPLFGFWANYRKKSRDPLAVSLVIELLSNVMYTYMESFPSYNKYYLILARGLIGFGAGNVAVVRSYVSGATTVKERTGAMANVSIFQTIGFILGPAIQAALVPLGHPGPVHEVWFRLDMYTAPGYFGAILCIVNIVLLVVVFREHNVLDHDLSVSTTIQDNSYEEVVPSYKPDYLAVIASISIFFVVLFIFTVFETIATPLTMNEFAWTKDKATLYNGIILATAGVEAIAVFIGLKFLSKRINERFLLIGGFVLCMLGYFVFLPWGNELPIRSPAVIEISSTTGATQISKSYSSQMSWTTSALLPTDANSTTTTMPPFPHFNVHFKESSTAGPSFNITIPVPPSDEYSNRKTNITDITGIKNTTSYNRDSTTSGTLHSRTGISLRSTKAKNTGHSIPSITTRTTTRLSNIKTVNTRTSLLNTKTSSKVSSITPEQSTPIFRTVDTFPIQTTVASTSTVEPEGCPSTMSWCNELPRIYLPQYLVGVVLISAGYPCTSVMTYTIYSKILGPKPQGTWMGWLTASGSLARTLGPVFVSQIYTAYGPRVTFSTDCAIVLLTIIGVCFVFKRLVPFTFTGKVDESAKV